MDLELSNKEFVKRYIPFRELKKAGFFNKEIKRTDYDAIVERFLQFWNTTKRQYILTQPNFDLQLHPDFITGRMPSSIDKEGKLIDRTGFKLSL